MKEAVSNGRFVVTSAFGVGRLMGLNGGVATVRYFTGPSRTPYVERQHEQDALRRAVLRPPTRVYLHDGQRWRIGRMDGTADDRNVYAIAFPNLEGARLQEEDFEVRWNQPIDDPFALLESLGGDSPIVSEARLGFLRKWTRQRAASSGVDGLLQASVELHQHQLAVVRRVASDPIKRYLLADEVGLGKTIEAAALICHLLARKSNSRVLVLVPQHLRHQWAHELLDRFRTDRFRNSSLLIRPLEDDSKWPLESMDMVVIDEAHRVTRNGSLSIASRRRIAEIAHSADELLLLSATPVRSNEAGFLDLLHLLDPEHYQPDQVEAFTQRVKDRDTLALISQGLVSDIDEFDLSLYGEQLVNAYPGDVLLGSLLASANASGDRDRPAAVSRVRQHLSEAYRLHRRVLRTRRTPELVVNFGVRGRKRSRPFLVSVDTSSGSRRTHLLDKLRLEVAAASEEGDLDADTALGLFREVAQRCGSIPHALQPLKSTHAGGDGSHLETFRQLMNVGVLSNYDSDIDALLVECNSQVEAVVDALAHFTGSRTQSRVVVASAFTESAVAVWTEMSRRWGRERVAQHLSTNLEAENREAVERWTMGGRCSILVVDASAEEGANLQIADLLIHVDLPWETFRIEQRIGRCDRHTATRMGPIESKVVVLGDEPYAMGWLEFVADGCDAFSRSLSTLQYVLSDTESEAQANALRFGPDALGDAAIEQVDRLAVERVRIIAHDALDEVEENAFGVGEESADLRLIKSDQNPALSARLLRWLEGVGCKLDIDDGQSVRIRSRPRPQVPADLENRMSAYFNSSMAINRSACVERRLPILRAGHSMVDAIGEHLLVDDRGVASAMFRPRSDQVGTDVAFRADFLVSATLSDHSLDAAHALGLGDWIHQLLQYVSPPLVERIVLGPDGAEVTEGFLLYPYDPRRDRNLMANPELFKVLTSSLDWTKLCSDASVQTLAHLQRLPSIVDGPRLSALRVKEAIARRLDRNRARKNAGFVDVENEFGQLEDLVPERLEIKIRSLGCAAIVFADPSRLGSE